MGLVSPGATVEIEKGSIGSRLSGLAAFTVLKVESWPCGLDRKLRHRLEHSPPSKFCDKDGGRVRLQFGSQKVVERLGGRNGGVAPSQPHWWLSLHRRTALPMTNTLGGGEPI